mgnify:CR=1 FL=1
MQSKDGQLHVQYTARFAASPMQSKDGQLHVQYTARCAASPMQSKDGQLHVQYTDRFAASPMQSKDGQLHVQYTARFAASPMQSKDRQLHVFPYAFGNCKGVILINLLSDLGVLGRSNPRRNNCSSDLQIYLQPIQTDNHVSRSCRRTL